MLPSDPILTQFQTATSAAAMQKYIQSLIEPEMAETLFVSSCLVHRFRYRKSTRAILLYEVQVADAYGHNIQKHWLSGSIFKGGKAKKEYDKLKQTRGPLDDDTSQMPFAPFSYIRDLEMLVQCFPADRHLPALARILRPDNAEIKSVLLGQVAASDATCERYEMKLKRYRPGISSTLSTVLRVQDGDSDRLETVRAFVKVSRNGDAEKACRQLTLLKNAADRTGGKFSVVRPLGVAPKSGALFLGPAPGQPLETKLLSMAAPEGVAERCAIALSALHLSGAAIEHVRPTSEFVSRAQRAAALLKWGCPQLGEPIDDLLKRIDLGATDIPESPAHLDMKADHIYVDDSTITFIDLDSCALANPVYDPAMLEVRLEALADLHPEAREQIHRFLTTFNTVYFASVPSHWRSCVRSLYACAAFKVALFHLQHQTHEWARKSACILERAAVRMRGAS